MVVLYLSQTWPINPPGAEPVLSLEQVWDVLVIKCRQPERFVKPIASCTVLEDTDTFIKREVVFREVGASPSVASGWGTRLTMYSLGHGPSRRTHG